MLRVVLLIGCVLIHLNSAHAQNRAPADLFPADVPFYVETVATPAFISTIEKVIEGTPWTDALSKIHERHNTKAARQSAAWLGQYHLELTLLTAPESRAELRKLGGIGFAYLGLNASKQPRYAAVLLTGESKIAELVIRAWLTNKDAGWRVVGKVEPTLPVYQRRPVDDNFAHHDAKIQDRSWPIGANEPTLLFMPGLTVIASDLEAIKDVLTKYREPTTAKALSQSVTYQARLKSEPQDALMRFFAKPAVLLADADMFRKQKPGSPGGTLAAYLRFVFGVDTLPECHGTLSMNKEAVKVTFSGVPPKHPVYALFQQAEVDPRLGNGLFLSMPFRFAMRFPSGEKNRILLGEMLDNIARAEGNVGKKPSELLQELEAKKPLKVLNDISNVGVAYSPLGTASLYLSFTQARPLGERTEEVISLLRLKYGAALPLNREKREDHFDNWEAITLSGKQRTLLEVRETSVTIYTDEHVRLVDGGIEFPAPNTALQGTIKLSSFFMEHEPRNQQQQPRNDPRGNDPIPQPTALGSLLDAWFPPVDVRLNAQPERFTLTLTIRQWHETLKKFFDPAVADEEP